LIRAVRQHYKEQNRVVDKVSFFLRFCFFHDSLPALLAA
jgi:hypothetical protein